MGGENNSINKKKNNFSIPQKKQVRVP